MAHGDEQLDRYDITYLMNRCHELPFEQMFDGRMHTWGAGEVRPVPRCDMEFFLNKSVLKWDPTFMQQPIFQLVEVFMNGQPVVPTADATPISAEQVAHARKFGILDFTNLPADRELGGMILMDEEGNVPRNVAAARFTQTPVPNRKVTPPPAAETAAALTDATNAMAAAVADL